MSHQRAHSTPAFHIPPVPSSSSASSTTTSADRPGGMATTAKVSFEPSVPPSAAAASSGAPISIAIPRQRSFSSSFSLATSSPHTFTGPSILTNPSNPFLNSASGAPHSPFSGPFGPMSPTTATAPSSLPPVPSSPVSQTMPVLHRRFSSSFQQLNQIAVSSPSATVSSQPVERGRRTSLFALTGSSPPNSGGVQVQENTNKASGSVISGGLFRKFSTTGRSTGSSRENSDMGPTGCGPQPNTVSSGHPAAGATKLQSLFDPPVPSKAAPSTTTTGHLTAVDRLKPAHEHSRSSSPMRSMILGQMLD